MGNTLHTHTLPPPRTDAPAPLQLQELGLHQVQSPDDANRLFTCEICIEPMPIAEKRFRNACAHPFCTDCMIKYIRLKLDDHNTADIKCPAYNCDRRLDPLACAPLLGDALFLRWCDVLCQAAIVDFAQCYCPYRNCNVLIVNECGGTVSKSNCPSCKRCFCFQCRRVWHAGFRCEDSGELRDRNDVVFGRLAEQKQWMRCPRCRHFVELMEGCQIVRCRCGISFCYKCGKQVHQHWCRCDATSMCCELCFRICIVLIFLTFGLFFLTWEAGRFKHIKK